MISCYSNIFRVKKGVLSKRLERVLSGKVDCWIGTNVDCVAEVRLTFVLQIVNPKGEMKGSAITGPVGKEAAELWPVSPTYATVQLPSANDAVAYCKQLRRRYVMRLSYGVHG